jgi:hypothetical protein
MEILTTHLTRCELTKVPLSTKNTQNPMGTMIGMALAVEEE